MLDNDKKLFSFLIRININKTIKTLSIQQCCCLRYEEKSLIPIE